MQPYQYQPQYAAQPYQPIYPYQPQQAQQQGNLVSVMGPESAKAYRMGPGSAMVLFDANEPVFYLKTTDDGGFASLRTFRFEEVQGERQEPGNTDLRQQVSDLASQVSELSGQMAEAKKALEGLM